MSNVSFEMSGVSWPEIAVSGTLRRQVGPGTAVSTALGRQVGPGMAFALECRFRGPLLALSSALFEMSGVSRPEMAVSGALGRQAGSGTAVSTQNRSWGATEVPKIVPKTVPGASSG